MNHYFKEILERCPVIAAVKNADGLEQCLMSECDIVFVLFGDILSLPDIIKRIKDAGKIAMIHMDLIAGLSAKEISVDYIKLHTTADGIITTKPNLIKRGKELGLYTVLRLFVLDSMAYDNIAKQCIACKPDCIEILPGVMPKVIKRVCNNERTPVIAGGLISDKEDILMALQAGAISVSTSSAALWKL